LPASIFLSYASEDREPARTIGDAIGKLGIDVWLDESELGGGDAWDQKIRRQIRDCDFFMPIVSARTEARREGYFRREWRLAVERTLDMADDHLFLLPVVIDDTDQAHARVPEKFLAVQWLRLPQGQPTPALDALCRRILAGDPQEPAAGKNKPSSLKSASLQSASLQSASLQSASLEPAVASKRRRPPPPPYPPFPREEPGQRVRFWAHVLGWLGHSAWVSLQRLPRWIRIIVYAWIATVALSRGCTHGSHDRSEISQPEAKKLKAITDAYRGSSNPADIARLGAQIAREFSDDDAGDAGHHALFAIPFSAPADDPAASKLADAAFAQTYGRLSMTRRGQVGLDKDASASNDAGGALAHARASHSAYVVYGTVRSQGPSQVLSVTIARVSDGSVIWTQSYPVASADAAKIAEDVNSEAPAAAPDED
jgi:TolB-like protein